MTIQYKGSEHLEYQGQKTINSISLIYWLQHLALGTATAPYNFVKLHHPKLLHFIKINKEAQEEFPNLEQV